MAQPRQPEPVKLIVGMISRFEDAFRLAETDLCKHFGAIDSRSAEFPFDITDYYSDQMGTNLTRRFLSFADLIAPDRLAEIKLLTNQLERDLAATAKWPVERPINIDPGYVTLSKLILATTKDYAHRVYLGRGIYAEVTLKFKKGKFEPWPWTYPDYRTEGYLSWFAKVRDLCLRTAKGGGPSA